MNVVLFFLPLLNHTFGCPTPNSEYPYFPVNQKGVLSVNSKKENQAKMHKQKSQFSPGHSPTSFLQNRNKAKELLCSFKQPGPKGSRREKMNSELSVLK
jgi:hypothetical protein